MKLIVNGVDVAMNSRNGIDVELRSEGQDEEIIGPIYVKFTGCRVKIIGDTHQHEAVFLDWSGIEAVPKLILEGFKVGDQSM